MTRNQQEGCQRVTRRLRHWARRLVWQLPDGGYPSEHPWSRHHGGTPIG